MLVQKYRDMLSQKSVIRQLSEFAAARGRYCKGEPGLFLTKFS